MRRSDLKSIKEVALTFLYIDVENTKWSPAVVIHPIFNSGIIQLGGEFVDITASEENLERVRQKIKDDILAKENIFEVWNIIRVQYRLTFLKYIEPYLITHDFSEMLADAWITSENPNQDINVRLSTAAKWFRKADKHVLMDDDEYTVYENLPETFTVYRGVAVGRNPAGMSWTRNIMTATWFAHRFDKEEKTGYVQSATAHKEDVLAYFNRRNEDELVISKRSLTDIAKLPEECEENG